MLMVLSDFILKMGDSGQISVFLAADMLTRASAIACKFTVIVVLHYTPEALQVILSSLYCIYFILYSFYSLIKW